MNGIFKNFASLGPARLALLGGILISVLGFFVYLMVRVSAPDMTLLYANLDMKDAGSIISKLESMSIPYEIKGDGSQIYAPANQVARLRMTLAEAGLPNGGSMGYEIFDQGETLGATTFMQNITHLRALEGELAKTIQSLAPVHTARVHLVLPKRDLFSKDKQEPTASIILHLKGGTQLSGQNTQAIQHLVASAVPGLSPQRISIVDNKGTLLARAESEGNGGLALNNQEDLKATQESKLQQAIISLLEKTVGPGKVRAEVNIDLDFNRITENSEIFDPDSQVVRSQHTIEENSGVSDTNAGQAVSVASNLPNPAETQAGGQNLNKTEKTDSVINYEISKTIKTHVRESGTIEKISVAVLVDGNYEKGEKGESLYKPRSPEELEQLAKLVRSSIGFNEKRGDIVEVINMKFIEDTLEPAALEANSLPFGLSQGNLLRLAEFALIAVIGVLIIFLVIRPLLTQVGGRVSASIGAPTPSLVPNTSESEANLSLAKPTNASSAESMINIDQVEGRVKASSLNKISEIVEKHPESAVSIIRTWMAQDK